MESRTVLTAASSPLQQEEYGVAPVLANADRRSEAVAQSMGRQDGRSPVHCPGGAGAGRPGRSRIGPGAADPKKRLGRVPLEAIQYDPIWRAARSRRSSNVHPQDQGISGRCSLRHGRRSGCIAR